MLKNIESLPETSKIWIFQASRKLTQPEKATVSKTCEAFLNQWAAHGTQLDAAYEIPYDQFIVIAQDQSTSQASGCSIDKCMHMVQNLGQQLNIDFLDRSKIAFLSKDQQIRLVDFKSVGEELSSGILNADVGVFNNNVESLKKYREQWVSPLKNTWLKRYLEKSDI